MLVILLTNFFIFQLKKNKLFYICSFVFSILFRIYRKINKNGITESLSCTLLFYRITKKGSTIKFLDGTRFDKPQKSYTCQIPTSENLVSEIYLQPLISFCGPRTIVVSPNSTVRFFLIIIIKPNI